MAFTIRVYHNDIFEDYSISDVKSFSIGSGTKDDCIIPDIDVKKSHVCFQYSKNTWKVKCIGEVFFANERIKAKEIQKNDIYILNRDKKIAVLVFENQPDSNEHIELEQVDEISIGRSDTNAIVLNSKRVSGHHAKIYQMGGEIRVSDIGSANGTYVNSKLIRDTALTDGDIITVGIYNITIQGNALTFQNVGNDMEINIINNRRSDKREYPNFMRSPRLKPEIPSGEIEIQAPPGMGAKPEINWWTVLLPPISMIVVMVGVVMFTNGNISTLFYTAPMSLIGIMVSLMNYQGQKKKHKKTEATRLTKYNEHLQESISEIESKVKQQLNAYLTAHPNTSDCAKIAENLERRLWERKPQDKDFMILRVGSGIMDFHVQIKIPRKNIIIEDDKLLSKPQEIADKYKSINAAPITYDILSSSTGGVVGDRSNMIDVARNMIVHAATHHCYDELKIIALFPKEETESWEWMRWLPHTFNDARSERYLANDLHGATQVYKQLEDILNQRTRELKEDNDYQNKDVKMPYYLFLVADRRLVEGQSILKHLASNDPRLGVGTLFLYDEISLLPRDCSTIIEVKNNKGVVYNKENIACKRAFTIDRVSTEMYERFSRALAPVRVNTMSEDMLLPSCVTFLEGYSVKKPEQINVYEEWKNPMAYKSMAVPIGVKANGDKFYFDIHEKQHGPHGLVAGMTGSGKSEMVQSWILSMALKFSPEDVSFVLIDFKGTGLILPFLNMPHLAGTISDLDTNINRNLIALENELSRRKALLDDLGVNNINAYLKLRKEGKAKEPLSFLFIIIDEFAEFKVQFPDFMTVVNRIFAIGRTLGVFAILLTQKPSGVVDDKMNANTRFRWCLKVASSNDSKEMIKHPDAAKITNAGRAYVQVGEDEVFELIQSYWSGAPYNPNKTTKTIVKPRISAVDLSGKRISYDLQEKSVGYKAEINEIDAVIKQLNHVVDDNKLNKAQKIWMQKLPESLSLDKLLENGFDGEQWSEPPNGLCATVGLIDDPRSQAQYPLTFKITEDGHVAIYGAPGTGKTTLLQTLVMSLIRVYTPEDVNIYMMDFGSWSMGIFKDFPHIGGIANSNEEEKVEKLVRLLNKELENRKMLFASQGVGSLSSYIDATNDKLPYIVLVLDNFAPVMEMYPNLDQFFITLTGSGGNYGIYFVTSTNNTMSLGFKLSQNIKSAAALQMSDKADYATIVGKTDGLEPENNTGRGLVKGANPLEFQTALPCDGITERERVERIRELAKVMSEKWHGKKAKPIPIMPEIINFGSVITDGIAIGLSTVDVEPIGISFKNQHHMIVSGKASSGKSTILRVITKQFMLRNESAKLVIFDTVNQSLKDLQSVAVEYIINASEFDNYMEKLVPLLQERKKLYQENSKTEFEAVFIVIDDLKQCFDTIKDETAKRLDAIIRLGKGLNVNLLVSGNCDDIAKMSNQGEAFTIDLVSAQSSILLGGSFRNHGAFKANIPYSEAEINVGEFEGYFLQKEKLLRFKAMNDK